MQELLETVFGRDVDPEHIGVAHMVARAVVLFFAALLLLRLSGKRTFGANAPFDMVVKIMLGAVLSRAVVAASPFGPTLLASFVLVALHRLLAWAAFRSDWVGWLVKGEAHALVEDGQPQPEQLRAQNITDKDLREGLRENGLTDPAQAALVQLERSGRISVVKKP